MTSDYAHSTHGSRQPLRRFAHLKRFERALELLQLAPHQAVLDLGAGDGYFLRRVASVAPQTTLAAVEPNPQMGERLRADLHALIEAGRLQVAARGDELGPAQFDRLVCLDVLEHLPPLEQHRALSMLHRVARPGALLVVSVPIEVGPVAAVKAAARWLNDEPLESWPHLLRAIIARPVPRPDGDYIASHSGFRFTDLERELEKSAWHIERKQFSPWRFGGWLLNSQVLYVLRATAGQSVRGVQPVPTIQLELPS